MTVFTFGVPIFIGFQTVWWIGLIAFFVQWVIGAGLGVAALAASESIPMSVMTAWAWLKPPLVAAVVIGGALYVYN
ncbi:MAG: hypothetical protein V7742_21615 [Halioglobus sp.]